MFGFKSKQPKSPEEAAPLDMTTSNDANSIDNNAIKLSVDFQVLKDSGVATGADLVGSIDQGTSSTRFLVFTVSGRIAASAQLEHQQIFPQGEDKVSLSSCSVRRGQSRFRMEAHIYLYIARFLSLYLSLARSLSLSLFVNFIMITGWLARTRSA
jgi:hypothetical protein